MEHLNGRPILLLAALLWALILALRARLRGPLLLYLGAEFVTTAALEYVNWRDGWRSEAYTRAYLWARPLELAMALNLSHPKAVGGIIALLSAWCVYLTVGTDLTFNGSIALVEGCFFTLAGVSLGFEVPFRAQKLIYGPLAVMWMLLGLFDYGYAMNESLPAWASLNEWWPTALCVVVFVWMGWRFTKEDGHGLQGKSVWQHSG